MRISDWSSDVCSSDLRSGQRIQILPGGGKQTPRRIVAEPALHRHIAAAVVRALHVEKRPAPGGLHHIPAIGRGLGIVDDEHGGGALPGRLLELVGPAAVIGHRPALDIALPHRLLPVRIVADAPDRLSPTVYPTIIFQTPSPCIITT